MSAEEIAAQQAVVTQQLPAGYMPYQQAPGAAGQVAGVDVLVGVAMGQGTEAEQQALQTQLADVNAPLNGLLNLPNRLTSI